MAVTMTALTSGTATANASSASTASVTPGGNKLLFAVVGNRSTSGAATLPTCSGNGLTWVQVATVLSGGAGDNRNRITIFRAMGASPSSGAITFDAAGTNQETWAWSVVEFGGVDTSGTNGSGAVVQSVTQQETTSVTTTTATLAAFGSIDNATFGAIAHEKADEAHTPGTGFTEIHDLQPGGAEDISLMTEWRVDNDTTVDGSWATSRKAGAIGAEIKADVNVVRDPGTASATTAAATVAAAMSLLVGSATAAIAEPGIIFPAPTATATTAVVEPSIRLSPGTATASAAVAEPTFRLTLGAASATTAVAEPSIRMSPGTATATAAVAGLGSILAAPTATATVAVTEPSIRMSPGTAAATSASATPAFRLTIGTSAATGASSSPNSIHSIPTGAATAATAGPGIALPAATASVTAAATAPIATVSVPITSGIATAATADPLGIRLGVLNGEATGAGAILGHIAQTTTTVATSASADPAIKLGMGAATVSTFATDPTWILTAESISPQSGSAAAAITEPGSGLSPATGSASAVGVLLGFGFGLPTGTAETFGDVVDIAIAPATNEPSQGTATAATVGPGIKLPVGTAAATTGGSYVKTNRKVLPPWLMRHDYIQAVGIEGEMEYAS